MNRRHSSWLRLAFSRDRPTCPEQDRADRFARLILPHLDSAWRYARYLCRDASAAEDLVHDAYVRALKAIDQCSGDPRAWLFMILRNCHHDEARRSARMPSTDIDEVHDLAGSDDLQAQAEITDLRRTIASLPEPFREALVLREIEDMSYRDISDVTGAPIGTVMSRLARARQMLGMIVRGDDRNGGKRDQA